MSRVYRILMFLIGGVLTMSTVYAGLLNPKPTSSKPQKDTVGVYVEIQEKEERLIHIMDSDSFFANPDAFETSKDLPQPTAAPSTIRQNDQKQPGSKAVPDKQASDLLTKKRKDTSRAREAEEIIEDEAWAEKLNAGLYPIARPSFDGDSLNKQSKLFEKCRPGIDQGNRHFVKMTAQFLEQHKNNKMALLLFFTAVFLGAVTGVLLFTVPIMALIVLLA